MSGRKRNTTFIAKQGSLLFVNFPRETSKVQILKTLSDKSWEFTRITCGYNILVQYQRFILNEICTN